MLLSSLCLTHCEPWLASDWASEFLELTLETTMDQFNMGQLGFPIATLLGVRKLMFEGHPKRSRFYSLKAENLKTQPLPKLAEAADGIGELTQVLILGSRSQMVPVISGSPLKKQPDCFEGAWALWGKGVFHERQRNTTKQNVRKSNKITIKNLQILAQPHSKRNLSNQSTYK